jgi:hypothetical protein
VTFTIGQDGNARSVVGPDSERIKIAGTNGIRNYVQLIVVDQTEKQVVAYSEERKENANDDQFELGVDGLVRDKTYAFLLLMGHWEHNGSYNYAAYADNPPTLLAAGLTKDKSLNPTGSTTVSITMYPLVVDTKFSEAEAGTTIIEPKMAGGQPKPVYLFPGVWDVVWTVQRSVAGTNGFERALIPAQEIIDPDADDTLLVNNSWFILPDVQTFSYGAGDTSNSITRNIPPLETQNGDSGSVNFNLEYVPFNLTNTSAWTDLTSSYSSLSAGFPVWIIRNGLNDLAQDGNTDFSNFGSSPNANRNGAIRYVVGLEPGLPVSTYLNIENMGFVGSPDTTAPKISFEIAGGNVGWVDAWYAVVAADTGEPDAGAYIWLGKLPQGTWEREIAVSPDMLITGYDVYMVITNNGYKSQAENISARFVGDTLVEWNWGIEEVQDLVGCISPLPIIGEYPDVGYFSSPCDGYYGEYVRWYDNVNGELVSSMFAPDTPVTAEVKLFAQPGFSFEDITFTYGSFEVSTRPYSEGSIILSVTFPGGIIDLSQHISVPTVGQIPYPSGSGFQGPWPNLYYYCSALSWSKSPNGTNWVALSPTEEVDLNNFYKVRIMLETGYYPFADGFLPFTDANFYCYGASDIGVVMWHSPSSIELEIFFPKPSPSP